MKTAWGSVAVAGWRNALTYIGYPEPSDDEAIGEMGTEVGALGPFDPSELAIYHDPIRSYFAGEPYNFGLLPAILDGSELQRRVWQATRSIPCGETRTYGDIALESGYPRAARAAGSALAANAAGLLVPCHRVVAANGIGGYGRRPNRKVALLRLEGAALPEIRVPGNRYVEHG